MNLKRFAGALALALTVAAPAADASMITVGSWTVGSGDGVAVTGTHTLNTNAARFTGNITSFSGPGLSASTFVDSLEEFYAFCYDLSELLGGNTYEVVFGTNPPNAFGVTQSTLNFLGAVNAYIAGGDAYDWLHASTAGLAAAIQLGLWETLYDDGGTFDLTAGNFRATGVNAATAAALNGILPLYGVANALNPALVMTLHTTGRNGQDLITGYRLPERIPEPGSLALLAIAAVAAGAMRRRRH